MIRLETILTPGRSRVNVPGGSKKKALEEIANLIGREVPSLDTQTVFEALIAREKLAPLDSVTASPYRIAGSKAAIRRSVPSFT